MPIFISQGRYTRDALKGMIANPEDRAETVAKLAQDVGGKLIAYYVTSGEYDFLSIIEAPSEKDVAAAILTAMASGGVTDMKTVTAMTSAEAKEVFARAGKLAASFRPAGGVS
jgi:uncharacterized protein with GYD domain